MSTYDSYADINKHSNTLYVRTYKLHHHSKKLSDCIDADIPKWKTPRPLKIVFDMDTFDDFNKLVENDFLKPETIVLSSTDLASIYCVFESVKKVEIRMWEIAGHDEEYYAQKIKNTSVFVEKLPLTVSSLKFVFCSDTVSRRRKALEIISAINFPVSISHLCITFGNHVEIKCVPEDFDITKIESISKIKRLKLL